MTKLSIYSAHVPRYTSYPTAPHFHRGVGGRDYQRWLGELAPGTPVSLYLHIPFCDTLCWFCACHTTVVNHYEPVRDYVRWLLREIEMVAGHLQGRHPVSHIHFGGGSPTLLAQEDMAGISGALRQYFHIVPNAEIAIEIDPRGFSATHADMLAEAGITRGSIGLQDCDPKVQRAINRLQSPKEIEGTVQLLRSRQIDRINFDLVYGLPYQTLAGLGKNLELALELKPSRMALFGYAHVPFFKKHQALIPTEALPGVEQRLEMAAYAERYLTARGYQAVGLDHFALPSDDLAVALRQGTLHRNFQGYTIDAEPALLGLGASAVSALPHAYLQNHASVALYRAALAAGRLPVAKGADLSAEDLLRRDVIEQIMCYLTVDLGATAEAHGENQDALDWVLPRLKPLLESGAVAVAGRKITVTATQRPAARIVASLFDQYLGTGIAKHSVSA